MAAGGNQPAGTAHGTRHGTTHDNLTPVGTPDSQYRVHKSTERIDTPDTRAIMTAKATAGSDASSDDMEKGDSEQDVGCMSGVCAPENNPGKLILRIVACICAGILFGLALEKSRVFEPATLRGQMILERWVMLKTFLAAMGTGQLVLAILSVLPWTKEKFASSMEAYASTLRCKSIVAIVVGTFILGSGMTLSGACPGMILAQVGSWTKNSIFTFIGVLVGSLLFGLIADTSIVKKISTPTKQLSTFSVQETLKFPYIAVALPMVFFIAIVVVLMEVFIDWEQDLDPHLRNDGDEGGNIFAMKSWPPAAAGVLIGVLQFVVVLAVGDTLGGSSSYQTLVSQWVVTKKLKETFPYMAKHRCGLGNWWQVFYVVSAMLGGFISSQASDLFSENRGVTIPCALSGGLMLSLGARLASGCTSGHGLSGAALLFWLSLIAVPVMFSGGIITGFIMKATGALDHYKCFSGAFEGVCPETIIH